MVGGTRSRSRADYARLSDDFRHWTLDAVPRASRGGALARAMRRPTRRRAVGRRSRLSRYAVRAAGCALGERASTLDQTDDDNGKPTGAPSRIPNDESATVEFGFTGPDRERPTEKALLPSAAPDPSARGVASRAFVDDAARVCGRLDAWWRRMRARRARVLAVRPPSRAPFRVRPDPAPSQIWDVPK